MSSTDVKSEIQILPGFWKLQLSGVYNGKALPEFISVCMSFFGLYSVCRATRQLHLKDDPCPGSSKPPLSISQNLPGPSDLVWGSQPVPPAQSSSNMQSLSWSLLSSPLIKHIPKSACPAYASHLAKLLRADIAQPCICKNWLALLNWGSSTLHSSQPNITSVIKKRIASFPNSVAYDQIISTRSHNSLVSFGTGCLR